MTKRAGKKKKSPVPPETTGMVPASQPVAPIATGDPDLDAVISAFWPELKPEQRASFEKLGRGEDVKRISDARIELKAINDRWPIPPDLRARMVFDAAMVAMNPKNATRDRLLAQKILLAMDAINTRPKGLPDQIPVAGGNVANVQVTVNQVLQVLEQKIGCPLGGDDLDFRDQKVIPGSENDYAD